MAYMTRQDWENFIRKKAFDMPTEVKRSPNLIDHIIEYEVKDGDFYHHCKLKLPFSAWHHGMLERFPVGHKFDTVVWDDNVISFYGEKGLISRHRVGVNIGAQQQADSLDKSD